MGQKMGGRGTDSKATPPVEKMQEVQSVRWTDKGLALGMQRTKSILSYLQCNICKGLWVRSVQDGLLCKAELLEP